MSSPLALVFLGLAGFLLGGAWSMNKQHKPVAVQLVTGVAGLVCAAVGVLYL